MGNCLADECGDRSARAFAGGKLERRIELWRGRQRVRMLGHPYRIFRTKKKNPSQRVTHQLISPCFLFSIHPTGLFIFHDRLLLPAAANRLEQSTSFLFFAHPISTLTQCHTHPLSPVGCSTGWKSLTILFVFFQTMHFYFKRKHFFLQQKKTRREKHTRLSRYRVSNLHLC